MGMSADEYWNAAPALATAYKEAYKLKQRQQNEFAWLQGLYIHSAVASIASGFGKGKKVEYPKKPIELGLETEEEKQKKVQRERDKIIANLTAWKRLWDKSQKAKSGDKP